MAEHLEDLTGCAGGGAGLALANLCARSRPSVVLDLFPECADLLDIGEIRAIAIWWHRGEDGVFLLGSGDPGCHQECAENNEHSR